MEIGSIFDINTTDLFYKNVGTIFKFPLENDYIYEDKKFFNTGRSAIEFLFRYCITNNCTEVLVPNYICNSVLDAIGRAGYKYKMYSITRDFDIDLNDLKRQLTQETKAILFINYFGGTISKETAEKLLELKKQGIVLIEDDTQCLFSRMKDIIGIGNYIVASIRKWVAIPDGAVLYAEVEKLPIVKLEEGYNQYSMLYLLAQIMKSEYLKNNNLDKNLYLKLIKQSTNELFSDYKIRKMTHISENLLLNMDINTIIERRRINYQFLYDELSKIREIELPVKLKNGMTPFGMPIFIKNREELFEYLIKNDIYCNIHWKGLMAGEVAIDVSNKILTIPCDQRYNLEHMKYVGEKLVNFYKEG